MCLQLGPKKVAGDMLTEEQIQHFHTFGFILLRGVLNPQELETISREYEIGLAKVDQTPKAAGVREQRYWSNLRPDMPFISGLLEEARFARAAEQLYGPDVVGCDSNSNHYAGGQSPWHPDSQDRHLFGFKFAFYLQPLDGNSGALRALPGSHKSPYYDHLYDILWPNGDSSGHGINVLDAPAFVCRTNPGDVIAFSFHVWHASWGGSPDRRMVSLQYQKSPKTPEEEESIRRHVTEHIEMIKEFGWKSGSHHPEWISNPGANPLRECWIGKLREWGYISQ